MPPGRHLNLRVRRLGDVVDEAGELAVKALMVQGTSSSAGKSLITTALARALRRRGIDVVPFKAQNMSNNARVVAGGEIGVAQYLQALAARVTPDVRMNPVLVKPESDTQSQVVLLGQPDLALSRLPWRARSVHLWPVIDDALQSLRVEHDVVLIEGAGSPAEINLKDTDLANMPTAIAAEASVILVADIDRGGSFAHLFGTWALLPPEHRDLIRGFVLNKFRGDPLLLAPGPAQLQDLTGVPMIGVLPWAAHGLPDEDGATDPVPNPRRKRASVVRYPTASNLDEFKALEQVVDLSWAASPASISSAELVILPGSKHVAADLGWLDRSGVADAVRTHVQSGRPVIGICGGMQMLGDRIEGLDSVEGSAVGLGLLPLVTRFRASKQVAHTSTRFVGLPGPWSALSHRSFTGYQIRHGYSEPTAPLAESLPGGLGFVDGPVLGVYLHGLFEQPGIVAALYGIVPPHPLDQVFDDLADLVDEHLDMEALIESIGFP